MFKRFLPIAVRNFPKILQITTFGLGYLTLKNYTKVFQPIKCSQYNPSQQTNVFLETLPKVIRIEHNGQIVGWAYCFSQGYLVTASHEFSDLKLDLSQYDFIVNDAKIKSKFKIIGKFENLVFIESQNKSLPILPGKKPDLFCPVHIIRYSNFFSIRDGYYVANDCGFGVINGKGQVGSLILNNDGIVGLVSQIGRDNDYGFLRVILWSDIKNIVSRMKQYKQKSFYLGMSVAALTQRNGLSVVRIAPNSPISSFFNMGDIITKVNNHTIRNPNDLSRIIMSSTKSIVFQVQDQNKNKRLITIQI